MSGHDITQMTYLHRLDGTVQTHVVVMLVDSDVILSTIIIIITIIVISPSV